VAQQGFATAYVYEKEIQVTTGSVRITLTPGIDAPKFSAVEVLEVVSAPVAAPVPTPVAAPVPVPVAAPVQTPVAAPVSSPVAAPTSSPVAAPVSSPVAAPTPGGVTYGAIIRVNAGGSAFTDALGQRWDPDTPYLYSAQGGTFQRSATLDILGTTNDELYRSERYFNKWVEPGIPYGYQIPVAKSGSYRVRLHFAEIYHTTAGKRKFSVMLEGAIVLNNLDLVDQVGAATAFVYESVVEITDGAVNIQLIADIDNGKISGVEILELISNVDPIRINVGGGATPYVDTKGKVWQSDTFVYGSKYGTDCTGVDPIAATAEDPLFCSSRWFGPTASRVMSIPIATPGKYTVRLLFAELVRASLLIMMAICLFLLCSPPAHSAPVIYFFFTVLFSH